MTAEASGAAEHLVARTKPRHAFANRLDDPGQLHPADHRLPGPEQPDDESRDKWRRRSQSPVRGAHRRRANADENLVVLRRRLVDVGDPDNLRRPVAAVNGGSHGFTFAAGRVRTTEV